MPLHLLPKKSWNVYSPANIARVRHDEAVAAAREAEAERNAHAAAYDRRIAILRARADDPTGTTPLPSAIPDDAELTAAAAAAAAAVVSGHPPTDANTGAGGGDDDDEDARIAADARAAERAATRSQRRRRGEDDTDRDVRLARAAIAGAATARHGGGGGVRKSEPRPARRDRGLAEDAPLRDRATGHFSLFPDAGAALAGRGGGGGGGGRGPRAGGGARANGAGEQPGASAGDGILPVRFADAAGRGAGSSAPWYAAGDRGRADSTKAIVPATPAGDSVNGSDGGGDGEVSAGVRACHSRLQRDRERAAASDPLAFMRRAQVQLKDAARDRRRWDEERATDSRRIRAGHGGKESSDRKRRRAGRDDDADVRGEEGLERFRLDADDDRGRHRWHRREKRKRSHRRRSDD